MLIAASTSCFATVESDSDHTLTGGRFQYALDMLTFTAEAMDSLANTNVNLNGEEYSDRPFFIARIDLTSLVSHS
jgi:hypothetical protein